jgi:hypothetical protein
MPREDNKGIGKADVRKYRRLKPLPQWRLPPLPWILFNGGAQLDQPPKRILLGGSVQEAFILAKSLPESEVVVLEESPKFARAMRISAQRRRLANLTVLQGMWSQPHLTESTGRNFDLILLPGFPVGPNDMAAALENLSQCASPLSARVYLRVTGENHPFIKKSEVSEAFGGKSDKAIFSSPTSPDLLLAAALAGDSMPDCTPLQSTSFSLSDWISVFKTVEFQFVSALHTPAILSRALAAGGLEALMDRGAESLAVLLDRIATPIERHIIFSTSPVPEPPWNIPDQLSNWRPFVHFWPREKIPLQNPPFNRVFSVDLEIQRVLPKMSLQLSAFMLELLRSSDGKKTLSEIISSIPHQASVDELRPALWFFHQACILNLRPPLP